MGFAFQGLDSELWLVGFRVYDLGVGLVQPVILRSLSWHAEAAAAGERNGV